ncbi:HAMP domain-containing protein [Phormidium sp. LEGE 05292]|uniref:sensor histidine kinase n=1 Tax=[Phormidium] sp. LEGE 05292 TaxID=767427 RepID=UPI00187E0A79|nr:ATP-binding protein [Phormidium sp. LEGE 05292]MBE9225948.1 HAMP domain-containing protein [Phormidium sp. LEGE 05292]
MLIRIKWNSIHTKLFTTYLALTALGTSVLASYILLSFHDYFMKTRQSDLDSWTTALSESVADSLENKNVERVDIIVKRYGSPESITLRIFDPQGRLLTTSAPDIDKNITNWLEVPGVKEALQKKAVQGKAKGLLSNDERLYAAKPIVRNGQLLGVLRMSITIEQFQRQFQRLILSVLLTLIITVLLCAVISECLTRSLARPIQSMCNFAVRMGSGHFGDKLSVRQDDELGQLAIELNRMSERLASLDSERRSFLANVSHELRTPVSNVFVTLEALSSGADEEPEIRDRFISTAQEEVKRLSRLIHDLLDLGRLEAGVTLLENKDFRLKSLIERAVRAVELRLQSNDVGIKLDLPNVKVNGDPERLLQAFLNILDNAIKYSVSNSEVSIIGQIEANKIIVKISDQGVGINESDMPHIFEQFYTADRSRSGNGTGLGLAIAKRIVEAHNGTITASSVPGRGATFTIKLPITKD